MSSLVYRLLGATKRKMRKRERCGSAETGATSEKGADLPWDVLLRAAPLPISAAREWIERLSRASRTDDDGV
jgi:hypothetical protein